jgi:ureidoglycolate lyase
MEARLTLLPIPVLPLSAADFAPYGTVLGAASGATFDHRGPMSDFRHEHAFEIGKTGGADGRTDILGVLYRDPGPDLRRMEMHRLTEQAVVPLTRDIVQAVALGAPDDGERPDLATIAAFRIPVGSGICMKRGCFHASFAPWGEARCLMLSRLSTTRDLASHLSRGAPLYESRITVLDPGTESGLFRLVL